MVKKIYLGVALGLLLVASIPAEASDRLSPWLFLARVSVNEAGWDSYSTGDMILIHEAFVRGSQRQGVSYLSYATHYSRRVAGIRPTASSRIAWTSNLRADGGEPIGWPRHISRRGTDGVVHLDPHPPWSMWRSQWMETVAQARTVAAWTSDTIDQWSLCETDVHDWGSPRLDRARAERMGLREVLCEAPSETQPVELTVTSAQDGYRLSRAILSLWSGSMTPMSLGNATVERWIRIGRVTVDGVLSEDRDLRVTAGQVLVVRPAPLNDSWSRPWLVAGPPPEATETSFVDIHAGSNEVVDPD